MYYVQQDGQLIVMLGGGEKSSQTEDIAAAKLMAARIKEDSHYS